MSAEVEKMKAHLVALNLFVASPAHEGYVSAKMLEIETVENDILNTLPDSDLNISLLNQAHGRLDTLKESLSTFENAARELKARIDEKVEQENKSGTTPKI